MYVPEACNYCIEDCCDICPVSVVLESKEDLVDCDESLELSCF